MGQDPRVHLRGLAWAGAGPGVALLLPSHVLARVPSRQKCPARWAPAGSQGTFPAPQHWVLAQPGALAPSQRCERALLAELQLGEQCRVSGAAGSAQGRAGEGRLAPGMAAGFAVPGRGVGAARVLASEHSVLMQGVMMAAYAGY